MRAKAGVLNINAMRRSVVFINIIPSRFLQCASRSGGLLPPNHNDGGNKPPLLGRLWERGATLPSPSALAQLKSLALPVRSFDRTKFTRSGEAKPNLFAQLGTCLFAQHHDDVGRSR